MSRAVVCDVCGEICLGRDYLELQGWYGKGTHFPGGRRKPDQWTVVELTKQPGIKADICRRCMESEFSFVALYLDETRQSQMARMRRENPKASSLKLLIRSGRGSTDRVLCDVCGQDCLDKHLQVHSAWAEVEADKQSVRVAEICEPCISARFEQVNWERTVPPSLLGEGSVDFEAVCKKD